jgi:hypothetical protein
MSVEETVVDPAPVVAVDPPAQADAPVVETQADASTDRDDKGRFRNPVQPRIDELTRKARENEREAAYWRQRAEAAEKPPAPPPEKPTPDKFDDYGAYVEALTDWKTDEKVKATLEARDKQQAEKTQTETRQSTWQQRKAEAAKAIPDLDAVLSASEVPLSAAVQTELLDSELGPQIAYHLDKHPELAEKLNGMTDKQVAREIGRLEATIGTVTPAAVTDDTPEPAPTPEPVTKKTTNAPPPVKPIGQGRSTAVDLTKLSGDDYVKARIAQGASWARR